MALNSAKNLKLHRGFTLIEVMISLVLFVSISLSLMNVIDQTTQAQKNIERWIQKKRRLNNVSYILQKDIQTAVQAVSVAYWAYDSYVGYSKERGTEDFLQNYLGSEDQNFLYSRPFPETGLLGNTDEMYLSGSSKEETRSLFKISYTVEPCLDKKTNLDVQCLLRKTSLMDDKELSELDPDHLQVFPLIKNVKKLQFQYFNSTDKEWKNSFSPPKPSESVYFPPSLPLAVRVTIEFEDSNKNLEINIPVHQMLISQKIHTPDVYKPKALEQRSQPDSSGSPNQDSQIRNSQGAGEKI